jgi:hypothetical protein
MPPENKENKATTNNEKPSLRKLKTSWHRIDRAMGEIDNAMEKLSGLNRDDDMEKLSHAFDALSSVKNRIEEQVNMQGGKLFSKS